MPVQMATAPPGFDQTGRLFDMQFKIGADLPGIEMAGPGAECFGIATGGGDVVGEGAAGINPPDIQCTVGQRAQAAATADVGHLEPDAFLGPDAHHDDVAFGCQVHGAQCGHGCEASQHTGGAIEVSAMRHGVEM